MGSDIVDRFLDALPAGEWADVVVLPNARGMMATRQWAVLATAKSLRDGRRAFLKFIPAASASAGPETLEVADRSRLERLKARLGQLRVRIPPLPMVPIIDVTFLDSLGGLLIAMEEVVVLHDVIEDGKVDDNMALKVLRDLHPSQANDNEWHHFDICPQNIGIRDQPADPVFIDLESLYLCNSGAFDVTFPAWKAFRAPATLADDVHYPFEMGSPYLLEIARRKQSFEVALVAAECSLGLMPVRVRDRFDGAVLQHWVAGSARDGNDPVVLFWLHEFRASLSAGGRMRSTLELAASLESLIDDRGSIGRAAPFPKPISRVDAVVPGSNSLHRPAAGVELGSRQFEEEELAAVWVNLAPTGDALRRGDLSRAEVAGYRAILEALVEKYRASSRLLNELLLVIIAFQKDPDAAERVLQAAAAKVPLDSDLSRTRRIVELWAKGARR